MKKEKKGIQGTPWHKEYLKKDELDPKRHKSRCYYYEKNYNGKKSYCRLLGTRCGTSAFCDNYKEVDKSGLKLPVRKSVKKSNSVKTSSPKINNHTIITDEDGLKRFPIGCQIIHKSFGIGKVKNITDGKIYFDFEEYGERIFSLNSVIKDKLVSRLADEK